MPKKIHQLSTTFQFTIEDVFRNIETTYVDISKAHSIIETIVNINFGNKFHHQNGPNQRQHIHKNTSQQYQYIPYQRPRNSQVTQLKENCI